MSHPNPSFDPGNSREDDAYYQNVQEPFEARMRDQELDARESNSD